MLRQLIIISGAMLVLLPVLWTFTERNDDRKAATGVSAVGSELTDDEMEKALTSNENPCSPPNGVGSSIEETAWRLLVAATCPVNQSEYPYVVWENWIEQTQLYPSDPSKGLKVPIPAYPSETLSFLVNTLSGGSHPFVLLDGVSLTQQPIPVDSATPEPASGALTVLSVADYFS